MSKLSALLKGAQRIVDALNRLAASNRRKAERKQTKAARLNAQAGDLKTEADVAARVAANLTGLFEGAVK